jgi:hypothetical protein
MDVTATAPSLRLEKDCSVFTLQVLGPKETEIQPSDVTSALASQRIGPAYSARVTGLTSSRV